MHQSVPGFSSRVIGWSGVKDECNRSNIVKNSKTSKRLTEIVNQQEEARENKRARRHMINTL